MERAQALVVDRDPTVRAAIRNVLEQRNLVTLGAASGADALDTLKARPVQLLFIDFATPGVSTLGLVPYARRLRSSPVIVRLLSSADDGVKSEKAEQGIFDSLAKPLETERLRHVAGRALHELELLTELRQLRERLQSREGYDTLVGRSPAMERLRAELTRLAATDRTLWFEGEEGSGKELAARSLHALSSRRDRPFVVVGCAGHTRPGWLRDVLGQGADSRGLLDQCRDGTLYFDEIAELPLADQDRLAKALEGGIGTADPSGGRAPRPVRWLAASSLPPETAIDRGRLLEPLYRCFAEGRLVLPPLRERAEDVPLLARHFISLIREINNLAPIEISPRALDALERYRWPGNVQELRNSVEHAVILATEGTIRRRDLPERILESRGEAGERSGAQRLADRKFRVAKREVVEAFERAYLAELLERFGGNVTSASRQAGMLRSALQRLLRKYGLKSADFRKARRAAAGKEPPKPRVE